MVKKRTNSKEFLKSRQRAGSADKNLNKYQASSDENNDSPDLYFDAWNPESGIGGQIDEETSTDSTEQGKETVEENLKTAVEHKDINIFVQDLLLQMVRLPGCPLHRGPFFIQASLAPAPPI
jgi:hypothetical protein